MKAARMARPANTRSKLVLPMVMALLAACAASNAGPKLTPIESLRAVQLPDTRRLSVVGTTTLVGDLLRQVGGEWIDLHVLLAAGRDPHDFQATPGDMRAAGGAAVIFVSGFGLEGNMLTTLADSFPDLPMVDLSQDLQPLEAAGSSAASAPETDPHVWLDPMNVIRWAENAAQALARLDPQNESHYAENAREFAARLQALDAWIRNEVDPIPVERRVLVTDHHMLDYFARRYDFEVLGTIIPGYSTEAEVSARDLARLEDEVRSAGARAIFIEHSANPQLAQTVAGDTGLIVVPLYVGALSGPDGPAADYIELMQYDVRTLVQALQESN
jgi:manganese/iron transport system substrate-binding protein